LSMAIQEQMEKTVFNSILAKKSILQDVFRKKIRSDRMDLTYFDLSIVEGVDYLLLKDQSANTLHSDDIAELSRTINELESREEVIVIVLTGNGKFFVAGADIQEFTDAFGEAEKASAISQNGQALCNQIESLRKPVIAAINGHCLGGGLELA